jgi:hypothetical protein
MYRFTIRDLLWLIVVVTLAVGWWLDHRHFDSFDRAMILSLKKQSQEGREWGENPQLSPNADANPPAALNEP